MQMDGGVGSDAEASVAESRKAGAALIACPKISTQTKNRGSMFPESGLNLSGKETQSLLFAGAAGNRKAAALCQNKGENLDPALA